MNTSICSSVADDSSDYDMQIECQHEGKILVITC